MLETWIAHLHQHEVPAFLLAQGLALVVAVLLLRHRLVAAGERSVLPIAAAMAAGTVLGGALLGPLLRLPRTLLGGGGDPFAPGWPMAYGALFGAFAATALAAKGRRRVALDALVPASGALVAIGRGGCFLSGCCFGERTSSWLGVAYPRGTHAFSVHAANGWVAPDAAHSEAVVAVPAIEAALGVVLVIAGILLPRRLPPGATFRAGVVLYAVGRILIETLRDDPRPMAGPMSLPQVISVMALAALVWAWARSSNDGAAARSNPSRSG